MFNNLFGDGRIGGILAVAIGLSLLALIVIYAWRAFGRGIKPAASRGARQPRLGIVDAFDLDRHRQLVLVRRDNVEHLIMIGGPNDLLIEEAIVRAQPSGVERREPSAATGERNGDRQAPRLPIEPGPVAPAAPSAPPMVAHPQGPASGQGSTSGQGQAPSLDVKPGLEPAATPNVTPPPLRPSLDPAMPETYAPPAPLARPAPMSPGAPRPMPPRPAPPVRPMTPLSAPRPGAPTLAQRPMTAPTVAPPAPPVSNDPPPAQDSMRESAREPAKEPAREPVQEAPKLTLNIDSLEEEMAKLLGRPVEPPKG